MSKPQPMKLNALLADLERLGVGRNEKAGQTSEELATSWGMSAEKVRTILRKALKAGVLRVGRAYRPNICGQMQPAPVYWLETEKTAKRKR